MNTPVAKRIARASPPVISPGSCRTRVELYVCQRCGCKRLRVHCLHACSRGRVIESGFGSGATKLMGALTFGAGGVTIAPAHVNKTSSACRRMGDGDRVGPRKVRDTTHHPTPYVVWIHLLSLGGDRFCGACMFCPACLFLKILEFVSAVSRLLAAEYAGLSSQGHAVESRTDLYPLQTTWLPLREVSK